MKRQSGVLLPLFSLPGRYGVGTLGAGARQFLDTLAAAGFTVFQTLPFCPPDRFRSPYAGRSSFAADPAYLDPAELVLSELLTKEEAAALEREDGETVDTDAISAKLALLKKAAARADRTAVEEFLHAHPETAAYCRAGCEREGIGFDTLAFLQYEFFREWDALRAYARLRGISLIGDLPIYSAPGSYDMLAYPAAFRSGGAVAGAPPDMFAVNGQIWGNPLYDYAAQERDGFAFLRARFGFLRAAFDGLRLDHFRGYSSFYAIPADSPATNGRWEPGPGQALFDALSDLTADYPIIAEDLGIIDNATEALRRENGFFSTRVLQFAFLGDPESPHLPHNCGADTVVYSGTHDNDTLASFLSGMPERERGYLLRYCGAERGENAVLAVLRTLLATHAPLVIFPLADLLGLGGEARINVPGCAEGNWRWRVSEARLATLDTETFLCYNRLFGR